MTDYLCLLVPFPPSVNHLYANNGRTGGRRKTKHYREWIKEAGQALLTQPRGARFTGRIKVTYAYGRPDKRKRDAFNYEKAVSDLLVQHGIIADDSLIEDGRVYWADDVVNGCRVEVEAA